MMQSARCLTASMLSYFCRNTLVTSKLSYQDRRKLISSLWMLSSVRNHGDYPEKEELSIKWVLKDGTEKITPAAVGANVMDIAHHHDIEIEGEF
jgi:hypothetical protein